MSDPGAAATDAIIEEIEKRIEIEYAQAQREIQGKLDAYNKAFETKDKVWQKWVADGVKSKDEYDRWRVGQIAVGKRWEEMRNSISQDLLNTNKIAQSIAKGYMPEVYALNHDYGTFQVEKGSLIDTSYSLYSRETAERLFRDDPQMLPAPGKKVSKDIAEGRALRWNNRHIQSVMMQALLQGNSIPDIATRLANAVCDTNRKAATRNARTMVTAAQNGGRIDAYKRAQSMGIKTRKQWLATLDNRTRHEHRMLDGAVADVDKPFIVDGEKIMFPGDPQAAPRLVYNCRCTLLSVIDNNAMDASDLSQRKSDKLGNMTYEEWRKGKETSNPILLPEEKAENIRASYIRAYRGYGGQVKSGLDKSLDIDAKRLEGIAMASSGGGGTSSSNYGKILNDGTIDGSMSKNAYREWRHQLNQSNYGIKEAIKKYTEYTEYINIGKDGYESPIGGSCYASYEDKVYFVIPKDYGNDKFEVLNHEIGHALDWGMDSKIESLTHGEFETISELISYAGTKKPSNSDRFLEAMREDKAIIQYATSLDGWKDINHDLVVHDSSGGVQDFIDGIFEKKPDNVSVLYGHSNEYYNGIASNYIYDSQSKVDLINTKKAQSDYNDYTIEEIAGMTRDYTVAVELWANIQSALTGGGEAEEYIRKFCPNSVEAYLSILKES